MAARAAPPSQKIKTVCPSQILIASATPIKAEMQNTLPQADVVAAENLHYFLWRKNIQANKKFNQDLSH